MSTESYMCIRAGGTGLAAPVLAGPIFQTPTIYFYLKPKKEYLKMSMPGKLSFFARVKRHFDGYLNCNALPGYITCKWQNSSEEVVPGVLFLLPCNTRPTTQTTLYLAMCVCVCILSKSMDQS